jgi:hypothetical protein
MKYRLLNANEIIEVGDVIKSCNALCKNTYEVHRVTEKFCFIKFNEKAEGKFSRIYTDLMFSILPRERFSMTTYTVYRKVEVENAQ